MSAFKDSFHIIIVDDDDRIRQLLKKFLLEHNFFVSSARNIVELETILYKFTGDLIILDQMMPGETGVSFLSRFRQISQLPILMLTAMSEISEKINGLEAGADDYLVKPFEPKELLLRINNILKRNKVTNDKIYFGNIFYDIKQKMLKSATDTIYFTHSEHDLLMMLHKFANQIVLREKIALEVDINERSVDVQVIRLRNKIEKNPSKPEILLTIRGQGYMLRV